MVVYLSHCCITVDVYIVPWRAGCCDSLSPHCVPVNMAHPSPPTPPLSHWFNSLPFYLWALVKAFRCKTFGFHWYKLLTDANEVDKLFSPVTQRWNSLLSRMCSGEFIPSVHTGWLILFALNNSVIERYQTQYLVRPIIYLLCGKQVQTDHRL